VTPFSNPSYLLPPLIASAVSAVLIVVVLFGARKSSGTWIFCCLLVSVGLWSLLLFGMRSSPDFQRALVWDRATPPIFLATFVLYYHFTLGYTRTKGQRGVLLASYLVLGVVAALVPTDLFVERMRLEDYGYAPVPGPIAFTIVASSLLLMGGGAYNLIRRYRVSSSYEERNRLFYLAIALLFPLVGVFLDGFTNLPPAAIWGNLLFSIFCTIAIVKYHLLDIRIAVRKGLVYVLISALVATPYVSVLIFLNQILHQRIEPWWVHAIIIFLLAISLRPLYSWAQPIVDRLFYRDRYDFLEELEDFSRETHDISSPNQLISSLVKLISRALRSSGVQLLLSSPSGDFITASSAGKRTSQFTIESDSPLLRWLRSNEGVLRRQSLDTIPQLQALTAKVRNELEKIRAKLFVPLKTKERELVGILILGEKLSEQPYSKEDEGLVVTVASRAAVELENARLYSQEKIMSSELQRQDKQKTEFLHGVAHELKTPLTAIISSSELLRTELSSTTPSQRQKLIRNINRSAWLMDKRVTELLDLAKMQVGSLELKSESLEIGIIIERVTSQLLPLFKNKEQSLKLEILGSLPAVKGDREKLEQILLNLLSNANKFSPAGGNITLRAREVDDRIVVAVKDSAPAITQEEKEKLFDPYYRGGDTDERQRIPGLGLGLAISKKLVELHQGRIWIESEPGGNRNIFAFSLPAWNMDKGN